MGTWNTLRHLRNVGRFVKVISDVTVAITALRAQMNMTGEAPDAPDLREQADSLARALAELAHKCSEPRADLDRRGYGPWRTPETLELSIAWYALLQIAAHVADCDVQYGRSLRLTDPSLPVITAASFPRRKKRGLRVSFSAESQQPSEFGQAARGTVPALTGKLARQLDHDLTNVFRKTAKAAQEIARHLPPNQPVTAFSMAAAIASVHGMNEWLEEQVQRIQRQYRIGVRGRSLLK